MNLSLEDGIITSDFPWRSKLKPIPNADRPRTLYLDREERERLIAQAPTDLAEFLGLLARVPLRPGAAAQLTVRDYDRSLGALVIRHDKSGINRQIALPPEICSYIERLCQNKLPSAPLLVRANGARWDKDAWKGPFKEAARLSELPSETTCYAIRHSVITDLMNLGFDAMTVARLSGTSIMMIEKHYGHLTNERARSALAQLCA
jgi:integrase